MITSNGNGTGVTATMDRLDIYDGLMALRKACQAQELELPSHLIDVAAECILEILQQEIITTPHKIKDENDRTVITLDEFRYSQDVVFSSIRETI